MLGSVARKLRIFGFDTLYIAHAPDEEILKTGIEQGRVILTADKELFKRVVKANAAGVLVGGADEIEDLVHVLAKSRIMSVRLDGIGSRCTACNGLLEGRTPDQVGGLLPDKMAEFRKEFYQCISCGKVYWQGGHLKRIRALAKSIDSKLGVASAT
jgi:uncharacterized protein with PIN domain